MNLVMTHVLPLQLHDLWYTCVHEKGAGGARPAQDTSDKSAPRTKKGAEKGACPGWSGCSLAAISQTACRRRRCASWASWRRRGTTVSTDIERASATWSTSSFTSYHGQLLSLAVQWGEVAIEIKDAP